MSRHALEVLEFERVLERVARRASSELGMVRVRALRPRSQREDIVRELGRVAAVMRYSEEHPDWALGSVPDARDALAQLGTEGAVLDPLSLHRIRVLLESSRLLKSELRKSDAGYVELDAIEARLVDLPQIERRIERSVDSEGTVLDTASRELKRIRNRLRGAHTRVVRQLESYLASLPSRFVVPDASVTIRDGRYVVPIRREGKGEVGGIVHGESQTGATLYVEPPVAIELMNRLRDLESEEAREIRRILGTLTATLASEREAIQGACDAVVEFDALQARARAARSWNGVVPDISEEGELGLRVRGARHPLLIEAHENPVVPFDLDLSADERALVVSGPNTGGKSVFLKTVGLVSALAQSGIVPPVAEGTRLPVFRTLFADIGDEQSIARSLSTFSAHLANLAEIATQADHASLVLIDEMGTGTDPSEGAALAKAVLEELVSRGATTLVTSHLGELKQLDTQGSGVVNGSLQFDSDRMEPTYRFVKGRPGRSYGLAIARRLGFPGALLDRAEAYRDEGGGRVEDVLARLERQESEAEELSLRLDVERRQTARLREDVERRERSVREAERTAEARARADARRLLLEARVEVEEAVRELRQTVASGEGLDEASREARRRIERAAEQYEPRPVGRVGGEPAQVNPGDRVRIQSTGSEGRVVEVRDERALIEAGALRLEVAVSDLEAMDVLSSERPREHAPGGWRGPPRDRVRIEVDLRGLRVDEMERELTKALDEALLGDLDELRIIHGKGTGALRKRVGEILRQDSRVRDFRIGAPTEGGAGVTVARF